MEDSPATRRGALIVRLAMLAAFATTLALGSLHADFPFIYHPDEPAKLAQVLTGQRNFNHPPFMLTLTRAVLDLGGITPTAPDAVRVGRWVSAAALALAAAGLTWLAGVYGGPGGAVCAAAALSTDAQVALAGHFFKEDALFALGFALTFCAGALHWRRRGTDTLLALGAAAGLAVSAKYVGGLAVGYALILAALAASPPDEAKGGWRVRARASGACALAAAAVFGLLNGVPLATHFEQFRRGLTLGLSVWENGNRSVGSRVPNLTFVGMFFLFTPLPVMAGAAAFWAGLRRHAFRTHADRWLAGLSPLWLLVAFSFSASTAVRYFLPISLMLDCTAGAAAPGLACWALGGWERRRGRPWPAWVPMVAGPGVILLFTLPGVGALVGGFGCDDREALRRWIARHLPPSAVIAEDSLARLEEAPRAGDTRLKQRVLSVPCVADLGDVAALRGLGVSWVVVCWYDSRRYVDPGKRPAKEAAADFERRGAFYRTLPARATRVWQSDLRQPFPMRPGLDLYRLDAR